MNKFQAIDYFWNSFGIKAYDENTVPPNVSSPHITYSTAIDGLDDTVPLTASLWDRSTSWKDISDKCTEIERRLAHGGQVIGVDGGGVWITKGRPFAQRMSDPSDTAIRRIYLQLQAEFLTND